MREFGAEANIKFVGAVGDRAANERGARELCCEMVKLFFHCPALRMEFIIW
jgi:hypothetical protein